MLLTNLQEDLLVLLSYDAEHALIVRNTIDPELFSGPYRYVSSCIYAYLDRYKKPPQDHLPDILGDKLDDKNPESEIYVDIVNAIYDNRKNINTDYVMHRLEAFVESRALRSIAIDLAKDLQRDTEESLEHAKQLLASANTQTLKLFDSGTYMQDKRAKAYRNGGDTSFPTGIPELDKRNLGPARKELWLLIGNAKAGKSWALVQLAKMAAMHRLKVCHVTLEMSEAKVSMRYHQALFSVAKRKGNVTITKFQRDSLGRISDLPQKVVQPALTMDDPKYEKRLDRRIARWANRILKNILVKQFPTGSLTIGQLMAYLDNLAMRDKFVPDLLMVDYPALMKLDPENYRLELDQTIKGLRGIAIARNIAVAIVSQSHRSAAKAKQVGAENVAEAYSQIAHADVVITYTQSVDEREMGLARLYVAAGRNDEDKFSVAVSQSYTLGQFALDSARVGGTYFQLLPKAEQ